MSEYPFFSVVIPTYNRASFLEATLQTVFTQTYPHYEVIVVDNASTDNTEELLQPYIQDGSIKFIRHERNFERARSRNTGMSAARGDFVTLLDSDDFMYPDNLADAAEFARSHPELKCFQNLYEIVDSQRNVLQRFPMAPLKNQLKAIASGNFMTCIGDFIHRDIYQNYQFDTTLELTGGEDWEFWLRVLADYPVGRINKINSGILQHSSRSVNNQDLNSMKRGLDYLVRKLTSDAHLSQVYEPYLNLIRANSYLYLAILAIGGGLFKEAKQFLKKAVKTDPTMVVNGRFLRLLRRACLRLQPRATKLATPASDN